MFQGLKQLNMKTFIVTFTTNYGLGVAIINAENYDKALDIAYAHPSVWAGFDIEEVDNTKSGVIFERS